MAGVDMSANKTQAIKSRHAVARPAGSARATMSDGAQRHSPTSSPRHRRKWPISGLQPASWKERMRALSSRRHAPIQSSCRNERPRRMRHDDSRDDACRVSADIGLSVMRRPNRKRRRRWRMRGAAVLAMAGQRLIRLLMGHEAIHQHKRSQRSFMPRSGTRWAH